MAPSAEAISALLGPLYEAAASPQHWPQFFEVLNDTIGTGRSFLLLADPENRCDIELVLGGVDPARQCAYREYFFSHDVVFERFMAAKHVYGEWVGTRQSVIADQDYHRSIIYNELAKPQGEHYQCGVALGGLEGGIEGGISISRSLSDGPFNTDEIALLAMLTPHLKRALTMHRVLCRERTHQAELRQTVEMLDLALLSLDGCRRVLRMTPAARAILESRDGIGLDRGFLKAGVPDEQRRLVELVAGAVATGNGNGAAYAYAVKRSTSTAPEAGSAPLWTPASGGAMLISRRPPSRPLQLVVTPFHSSEILLDEHPAALIFLNDPDARPASRASVLRALYRLSPTECRLADLLAQGCEVSAAAEVMRTSILTARFHLKAIFRKTGTARQSQLVRLVLGLPGTTRSEMDRHA